MPVITGATQFLGVIGDPIEHSLSPVMHNAALSALAQAQGADSLNYVYLPFRIAAQELSVALAGLAATGCRGFNVTIPHKQAVIPLLAQVSEIATTVGAVNTVWRTEQGWAGTNTDVQGFIAPLQRQARDWSGCTATILGSGGAARAAIAGCQQLGMTPINLVGRSPDKLEAVQRNFKQAVAGLDLAIHPWETLALLVPTTHLLINTTPIGMYPQSDISPVDATTLAALPSTAIVYDLIYNPNPTQLLQRAQACGNATIHGLEMLVQQGAAALEIWLGYPAPAELMQQAAAAYLFGE